MRFVEVGTFFLEMLTKCFFDTHQGSFGHHFGAILEALGSFLTFRSDFGEIFESVNRRSGKGTFQEAQPHFRVHRYTKGGRS